jgi:hypothetical protein
MPFLLAFEGRIARLPYLLWSLGIFFSQHLFTWFVFAVQGWPVPVSWKFVLFPLPAFVSSGLAPDAMLLVVILLGVMTGQLLVAWMLAALAFQRAADSDLGAWIAGLAIAPIVQIAVIAGLSLAPTRDAADPAHLPRRAGARNWPAAAQAAIAGMAVTLAAVALGTLVSGSYGYGVFMMSPFIVGVATGVIANWKQDRGTRDTARILTGALALGGGALLLVAIEGLICIAMAAPLALGMGHVGALLGRAIAIHSRRPARQMLASFTALPLVLLGETLLAPETSFQTENTVEIAAPPSAVWESLIDMGEITGPLPLAFRLGMAHPLRARMVGEGVGAVRLGVFSTGTALECITEWEPGRKLAFTVLRDVPAMRELSPYEHVHAPHVIGYFFTKGTSFELLPGESGGTRLIERTAHTLKLEPVLYWVPLARLVVGQNNARVLAHIKSRAEQAPALASAGALRSHERAQPGASLSTGDAPCLHERDGASSD